ncbi:MAG: HU family DNA-binding protein [Pseudoruegeria sp.]
MIDETGANEVDTTSVGDEEQGLRRKQLLDRVAELADTRKQIAKPIIEATLSVIGEALANGEEVNLQPLGNIKIKRVSDSDSASVIHARIRQSKGYASAAQDTVDVDAE